MDCQFQFGKLLRLVQQPAVQSLGTLLRDLIGQLNYKSFISDLVALGFLYRQLYGTRQDSDDLFRVFPFLGDVSVRRLVKDFQLLDYQSSNVSTPVPLWRVVHRAFMIIDMTQALEE
ncbi:MAG: hypothetical protein JKX87_07435 [Cycloclasticus sp.]|nr:hypothetical protein [Cycloclasticus sp.]